MPITFWTFAAGYLAIIGCPPFSGFWTKDKIIEAAFDKGGTSGWIFGILRPARRRPHRVLHDPADGHDVLRREALGRRHPPARVAAHHDRADDGAGRGSVVGGYLLIFGGGVQHWLTPVVGTSVEEGVHTGQPDGAGLLTPAWSSPAASAAGYCCSRPARSRRVAPVAVSPITTAARRSLYGDAINETLLMRPGQYLTRALVFLDTRGVDGAVNGLAALLGGGSSRSQAVADRIRTFLRAVDAGRRRRPGRRAAAGEGRMSTVSLADRRRRRAPGGLGRPGRRCPATSRPRRSRRLPPSGGGPTRSPASQPVQRPVPSSRPTTRTAPST